MTGKGWKIKLKNGVPSIRWRGMWFGPDQVVEACNFDLPFSAWKAFKAYLSSWRRSRLVEG